MSPQGAVWFAEATGYSITRLKDGEITRHVFASPRGDPYGVALAADGTVWATLKLGNQLLHITTNGEIQVSSCRNPQLLPRISRPGRTGPYGSSSFARTASAD